MMKMRLTSLASRFSLVANAVVAAAVAALLATSAGIRANDFPPLPPAIATAAAPSPTVGQPTSLSVDQYGSVRTLLMTPSGTAVDVTQSQPTYPYLSTSWTVNVVSCTSAGTVLALADSLGAAKQRSFVNVSGVTIYIGPASGVTATTGFAIPSGVAPSNPAPGYTGPVYCYAASTVSLGVSQLQ
jgi:hypothetical protein